MKNTLRFSGLLRRACAGLLLTVVCAHAEQPIPIADVHVHYSHDSVEMTPPERVIELMRSAGLKFALVSSSDDNGTQLLSNLAPDLIIPGLRPYRRRGELNTWFTDPEALAYVEKLLARHRYASLGEFHLYGDDANLEIPRRMVALADEHNLVLHAHSDAEAVDNLLAQNPNVKVLWAHAGFDSPAQIAPMLAKHDRLWADLAFRSEVGSGGLSDEWIALFKQFPDRLMLGTDTYTPERIFYVSEHAQHAREWLAALPAELAEKVAWKNAYDLLMPIWQQNRSAKADGGCHSLAPHGTEIVSDELAALLMPLSPIQVSEPFALELTLCGENVADGGTTLDAIMPKHGHGMNYTPEQTVLAQTDSQLKLRFDGLLLHMPGDWQWRVDIKKTGGRALLTQDFVVQ